MPEGPNISEEMIRSSANRPSEGDISASTAFVQMYYEHQYKRFSALEQQQLTFSNIIVGITTIAFTFGYTSSQGINAITGIGLPAIVIAINIFTILYYRRTSGYIRTHRKRAKRILELYGGYVFKIDQEIQWQRTGVRGWKFYASIHIFMVLVAFVPLFIYLQSII